ncbi:uncharacterized protein LOC122637068 [Vespula pensylvanica]|uniref:uncharacterized protein LOC122637068 n=1 Tax=Vespula pensylvanica TaxID=30213 RepID=UPI001CB9E1A1|nr:uncharacterized protein LOC122637068 [Vespula pensylvanica]XP_043684870.1 uncharacterized protein LOC122637068 [Vespula pensylvanica]
MVREFDKNFFERALRFGYKDETIEVLEYDVKNCCAKGANFLSDLYRSTLKLKRSTNVNDKEYNINVIIKCEPSMDASALEICSQQNLFKTELKIYTDVLKEIERITCQKIGPKLLYSSKDSKIFVMEDLNVEGYKTMDRQKGLSLHHCLLLIYKMAALHAGSVAFCEKNPELAKSFKGGILVNVLESFLKLSEISIINACGEIRRWSNDYHDCADKLERFASRMRRKEDIAEIYQYEMDEFCVINHGDCWINNIMFKDNELGEPSEVLLVDYQMSVYSSPAIDLLYFLNICPDNKLKYEKEDYFLKIYIRTLGNIMRTIGCVTKPPTIKDLKRSMYKRRLYAIFSGIVLYPRMVADECEHFEEVLGKLDGKTKLNVFKKEEAIVSTRKFIKFMNQQSYFD